MSMYKNTGMKTLTNTQLYYICVYINPCYEHEMIIDMVRGKWNTARLTTRQILTYTI